MTLDEVQARMRELLGRLNRAGAHFSFQIRAQQDGTPHVEGNGPEFDWIQTERGVELSRRRLTGPELLFVAMESLTAELAQQAELRTRGAGVYSRWRWMDAHIRLMRHLDPEWGERVSLRYHKVLSDHPLRADEAMAGMVPLDLSAFGIDGP